MEDALSLTAHMREDNPKMKRARAAEASRSHLEASSPVQEQTQAFAGALLPFAGMLPAQACVWASSTEWLGDGCPGVRMDTARTEGCGLVPPMASSPGQPMSHLQGHTVPSGNLLTPGVCRQSLKSNA